MKTHTFTMRNKQYPHRKHNEVKCNKQAFHSDKLFQHFFCANDIIHWCKNLWSHWYQQKKNEQLNNFSAKTFLLKNICLQLTANKNVYSFRRKYNWKKNKRAEEVLTQRALLHFAQTNKQLHKLFIKNGTIMPSYSNSSYHPYLQHFSLNRPAYNENLMHVEFGLLVSLNVHNSLRFW